MKKSRVIDLAAVRMGEGSEHVTIERMRIRDYEGVYGLWKSISGFRIRELDDSREGIASFLKRNPHTSMVARWRGEVVGSLLCGHDGRTGHFYHVCVREDMRGRGILKKMTAGAIAALEAEGIHQVSLVAFQENRLGNQAWRGLGWVPLEDINTYEYLIDPANVRVINA